MPPLLSSHMLCLMSSAVPNRPSGVRMPHSVRSAVLAQLSNSVRPACIMTQNENLLPVQLASSQEQSQTVQWREQGAQRSAFNGPACAAPSYSCKAPCREWHQC